MKNMDLMVMKYPTPVSINLFWNFGSLLGVSLLVQILTGIFLSFFYCSDISMAFGSLVHINNNVMSGWLIRYIHCNGVTFFFLFLYFHIGRGLFYKSYKLTKVWIVGVVILMIYMMVAFLGYVLPWGQMSYWGATVITNLISVIPQVGCLIVEWIWGGFSVSSPTLMRFFSFHFLLPFFGTLFIFIHLTFLHMKGSTNPLGVMMSVDKLSFHPKFSVKDFMGFMVYLCLLVFWVLKFPFMFMDSDNYMEANSMVTPVHIQPEWYFLFAYSILRSVPSKLGGVIMMLSSMLILMSLPSVKKSKSFSYIYKKVVSLLLLSVSVLTYIGSLPVESPFLELGQVFSMVYFVCFFFMLML
uniref:cytochrome b n=1 Tax=Eomenopon denticulatum TaxID=2965267 RepID=UPI0026E1C043|nr:cytochrome b [Eomenopon denticulatum]WIM51537.1 cytochrome b [Eomenopon denticulatum]